MAYPTDQPKAPAVKEQTVEEYLVELQKKIDALVAEREKLLAKGTL